MTGTRRTGTASAAVLSGLALALGLSHAAAPEWVRRAGLDVWNLTHVRAECRALADARDALEAGHAKICREIEVGEHLAARLAAGTLPLAEAAAEMEPILRKRPGFATTCAIQYKVPDFRRGAARYLIIKVGWVLDDDPNARDAALARLEAEFAAMR